MQSIVNDNISENIIMSFHCVVLLFLPLQRRTVCIVLPMLDKPEPRAGIDLMLMAMSEEPTPGVLTGAINEGDTRLLTAVFEKWPEKVTQVSIRMFCSVYSLGRSIQPIGVCRCYTWQR